MTLFEIVYAHLADLKGELKQIEVQKGYRGIHDAVSILVTECVAALERYKEGHSTQQTLTKEVVMGCMDFNERWNEWIIVSGNTAFKKPHYTKVFHEYLLRFAKGMIKAWRCWNIDLHKPE